MILSGLSGQGFGLIGRICRAAILVGGPRIMRHGMRALHLAERCTGSTTLPTGITRSHPVGFSTGGMQHRDPACCATLAGNQYLRSYLALPARSNRGQGSLFPEETIKTTQGATRVFPSLDHPEWRSATSSEAQNLEVPIPGPAVLPNLRRIHKTVLVPQEKVDAKEVQPKGWDQYLEDITAPTASPLRADPAPPSSAMPALRSSSFTLGAATIQIKPAKGLVISLSQCRTDCACHCVHGMGLR